MQASYLESKVLTAPPQRLHLMLVEGAIRFGRQAELALQSGNHIAAAGPLLRTLDILGELLAGVRESKGELNTKLTELYWFMFRRMSQAKINGDAAALAEVLKLLEFERQTWQLLCDKLNADSAPSVPAPKAIGYTTGKNAAAKSGFSFEA
jgi:flagellar protein FliS